MATKIEKGVFLSRERIIAIPKFNKLAREVIERNPLSLRGKGILAD